MDLPLAPTNLAPTCPLSAKQQAQVNAALAGIPAADLASVLGAGNDAGGLSFTNVGGVALNGGEISGVGTLGLDYLNVTNGGAVNLNGASISGTGSASFGSLNVSGGTAIGHAGSGVRSLTLTQSDNGGTPAFVIQSAAGEINWQFDGASIYTPGPQEFRADSWTFNDRVTAANWATIGSGGNATFAGNLSAGTARFGNYDYLTIDQYGAVSGLQLRDGAIASGVPIHVSAFPSLDFTGFGLSQPTLSVAANFGAPAAAVTINSFNGLTGLLVNGSLSVGNGATITGNTTVIGGDFTCNNGGGAFGHLLLGGAVYDPGLVLKASGSVGLSGSVSVGNGASVLNADGSATFGGNVSVGAIFLGSNGTQSPFINTGNPTYGPLSLGSANGINVVGRLLVSSGNPISSNESMFVGPGANNSSLTLQSSGNASVLIAPGGTTTTAAFATDGSATFDGPVNFGGASGHSYFDANGDLHGRSGLTIYSYDGFAQTAIFRPDTTQFFAGNHWFRGDVTLLGCGLKSIDPGSGSPAPLVLGDSVTTLTGNVIDAALPLIARSTISALGYSANGSSGFTGSGSYTNLTIVGGIITAAA